MVVALSIESNGDGDERNQWNDDRVKFSLRMGLFRMLEAIEDHSKINAGSITPEDLADFRRAGLALIELAVNQPDRFGRLGESAAEMESRARLTPLEEVLLEMYRELGPEIRQAISVWLRTDDIEDLVPYSWQLLARFRHKLGKSL
jgi:hypothetical protein